MRRVASKVRAISSDYNGIEIAYILASTFWPSNQLRQSRSQIGYGEFFRVYLLRARRFFHGKFLVRRSIPGFLVQYLLTSFSIGYFREGSLRKIKGLLWVPSPVLALKAFYALFPVMNNTYYIYFIFQRILVHEYLGKYNIILCKTFQPFSHQSV